MSSFIIENISTSSTEADDRPAENTPGPSPADHDGRLLVGDLVSTDGGDVEGTYRGVARWSPALIAIGTGGGVVWRPRSAVRFAFRFFERGPATDAYRRLLPTIRGFAGQVGATAPWIDAKIDLTEAD